MCVCIYIYIHDITTTCLWLFVSNCFWHPAWRWLPALKWPRILLDKQSSSLTVTSTVTWPLRNLGTSISGCRNSWILGSVPKKNTWKSTNVHQIPRKFWQIQVISPKTISKTLMILEVSGSQCRAPEPWPKSHKRNPVCRFAPLATVPWCLDKIRWGKISLWNMLFI